MIQPDFNVRENVRFGDWIHALYIRYVRHPFTGFLRYRKTYRNYLDVVNALRCNHFPIEAALNDSRAVVLRTRLEASFVATCYGRSGIQYDLQNQSVTVEFNSEVRLEFSDGINNGDLVEVFLDKAYEELDVRGKLVVDVGANIGDTPIYFVLRGASKVVALEPFPNSFRQAKENISKNSIGDRITLLNMACRSGSGVATLDPSHRGAASSTLTRLPQGVEVPIITLSDILDQYTAGSDLVLKMDCEGDEYDIILRTPKEVLRRFCVIYLEYHCGDKNLKQRLTECGFQVRAKLVYADEDRYVGYISAIRNMP